MEAISIVYVVVAAVAAAEQVDLAATSDFCLELVVLDGRRLCSIGHLLWQL